VTTDRSYKRRRPANEVIEDLQPNAGKQFAPELVTAFCRAMFKELTLQTKQKKFRRLLGRDYMEAEGIVPQLKNVLNDMNGTYSLTLVSLD